MTAVRRYGNGCLLFSDLSPGQSKGDKGEDMEKEQSDYPVWESMKEETTGGQVLVVVIIVAASIPLGYGLFAGIYALAQIMGSW